MTKGTLLQLTDLKVHYGGVRALDGAAVAVDEGEIVALMGPNGAGKSTVLKAIFGLAPVAGGAIKWRGHTIKPVTYEMTARGVAFVPQGRRVFRHLTVAENLELGAWQTKDKKLIAERLASVLELFPVLKTKLKAKSGTLSGGQQQMLAIARGLMCEPQILLLDEPSLGLAPKIVAEVFAKIKEINERRQMAIVVVEHNLKSLATIATRAYVLDKGRVVAHGQPQQLLDKGILEKVFMGQPVTG
jgi:branched-chain amino acid transport system ATP-binding protein